jgi:hypothetical protein
MISRFEIENPLDHWSSSTIIIIRRIGTLGRDLEYSKAHRLMLRQEDFPANAGMMNNSNSNP